MSRRHPKHRMTGRHFAQIPVEVLTSDAVRTLPNYALRVLLAMAAQFRGNNNGDLAMTRAIARPFGVTSQEHLVKSLALLLERRLIDKTRQGGKKPLGPTLYCVTWQPINDLCGKIALGPNLTPTNAWAVWKAPSGANPKLKNQRVCRRTTLGLPADQKAPISGLPADQKPASIGSAGSPPSRSPREGHGLQVLEGGRDATERPPSLQTSSASQRS